MEGGEEAAIAAGQRVPPSIVKVSGRESESESNKSLWSKS